MPRWARVLGWCVGLTMWVVMIIWSLILGQIPSGVVIGFPAGLWAVLRPGRSRTISPEQSDREDTTS